MMADSAGEARGWRVGHRGRDQMYYEEFRDGAWQRIEIDGEMLMGPAHHVIYFASPARWAEYPPWAQGRREEIMARIKSEFRAPDYEYYGDEPGGSTTPPTPGAAAPPRPNPPPRPRGDPHGARALLLAIALLFALAGGMGWLVVRGVTTGEVPIPIKQATLRRTASRQSEPAMFWFATGLYALVGAGALGLGGLGVREWRKL